MEIRILSKRQILDFLKTNPNIVTSFNIISIIDPESDFIFTDPNKNILQLKFSDVDERWPEEIILKEKLIRFNEEHAYKIIKFLNDLDISKNLLVHCSAGISRSGAVGDFARKFFKIPFEGDFETNNKWIQPNTLVSKILREISLTIDKQGDFE